MSEVTFTKDNFDKLIAKDLTLVDFWAPWCSPCRMQGPVIEKLAEKFNGKATIGKFNVDEEKSIPARYGVRSIPTIMLFKNGKAVKQFVGLQNEEALTRVINDHI